MGGYPSNRKEERERETEREREMEEQGGRRRQQRRQVVMTASPFQGHMTPLLQLATLLHARGFIITIAHAKLNSPDPSVYPDFHFIHLADNLSAVQAAASFLEDLNTNCREPFREHLTRMINERNRADDESTITVIHDNLMAFAGVVASDLNLPAIVLRSSSASYVPPLFALLKLHEEGRFPVQDSAMLQMIVPEFDPVRYKDLPFIDWPIEDTKRVLSLASRSVHPSAIVWNTVEFLEHSTISKIRQQYKVPIFAVGPLHKITPHLSTSFLEEDTRCIPWLDKHAPRSVIYVSLGSLATLDENTLAEMAWGLANSNQPFLWVVRPGSVRGSEWIDFLPEGFTEAIIGRGLIVKWAPQKEVLAHSAIGAFWTHCGWNSTLESMSEGVPMLCQPFIIDQGVNTRYVTYVWKIGLEFERLERNVIERAIRRLLVDKEGEELRHRAVEIKEKVRAALSQGGSSQNSLNSFVEFILSL